MHTIKNFVVDEAKHCKCSSNLQITMGTAQCRFECMNLHSPASAIQATCLGIVYIVCIKHSAGL